MKKLSLLFVMLTACVTLSAQKQYNVYAVGFYNQENLFDTCHDVGKNDQDFLPTGSYRWNGLKYSHKLKNMARVLAEMGTDVLPGVGCAFIGLAEVENEKVMQDLTAQEPLAARNFQYCHVEGPDRRGIDCALIYNPKLFSVRDVKLVPYVQALEKDSGYRTRGFLTVSGDMAGEHVTAVVCHWPSRYSGSFYREQAGLQVKALKDSILREDPDCKVFVMGDMNDDPSNRSMKVCLSAKADIKDVGADDMYNPWAKFLSKEGVGTLLYNGSWNLFDQIVMTPNLLDKEGTKDYTTLKYWKNQIFRRDYLIQSEGKYKGGPLRTHSSGVWLDGYSDHLPVVVYLVKEKQ